MRIADNRTQRRIARLVAQAVERDRRASSHKLSPTEIAADIWRQSRVRCGIEQDQKSGASA